MRELYRRYVPSAVRQRVRKGRRELAVRLRDLPDDLRERLGANATPLPPASLRSRVGIDSSRSHFVEVGRRAAADIVAIAGEAGGRWLDFGCGSGRVARHIAEHAAVTHLTGIDVDADAIRWARAHLRDEYLAVSPDPPTPLPAASFDLAYAVSVFTHFSEEAQLAWLGELRRLLRPGGLLVATTHGPHLVYNRPDLTVPEHEALRDRGFVFRPGIGPFNEDSAFHSREYLERTWSRDFELVRFVPAGLADYLDLSLWRARAQLFAAVTV